MLDRSPYGEILKVKDDSPGGCALQKMLLLVFALLSFVPTRHRLATRAMPKLNNIGDS